MSIQETVLIEHRKSNAAKSLREGHASVDMLDIFGIWYAKNLIIEQNLLVLEEY